MLKSSADAVFQKLGLVHLMIDWNRIEELRRDFGEEDFVEIVDEFFDEVQEKLASLDNVSGEELANDLHFLKGSAANLGFQALWLACGLAEQEPSSERTDEIRKLFEVSKAEFFQRLGKVA